MARNVHGDRESARRVIVVGGGVSGLSTALALAESGVPVLLLSESEPRRAPSVLDPDGFNAARAPGDSVAAHFEDSALAAGSSAASAPLRAMVRAAPALLDELFARGIPLQPTPVPSPNASAARTFHCGSETGQQLLFALDDALRGRGNEPVRDRYNAATSEPLVERRIGWEMLRLVFDDDRRVVGVIARDHRSGALKAFRGEAVCLASGGYAGLFGGAATSPRSTGNAIARALRQGALLANADCVGFRPLCVPGPDKSFGVSEFARSFGARIFASSNGRAAVDKDRDYFAEGAHPTNFRTLSASALLPLLYAQSESYVDFSHLPEADLTLCFGAFLERMRALGFGDARRVPLSVAPRADHSLGGLWVDHDVDARGELSQTSARNHATNLDGLYAVGECGQLYAGKGLLPGNGLLASVFGGRLAARAIQTYGESLARSAWDLPPSIFEKAEAREREAVTAVAARERAQDTNPFALRAELGRLLAGVRGDDPQTLVACSPELGALAERLSKAGVADTTTHENRSLELALQLEDLALLVRAIALSAQTRRRAAAQATDPAAPSDLFVRFDGELRVAVEPPGRAQTSREPHAEEQGANA